MIALIHKSNGASDPQQVIIPNGLYYISSYLKENGHDVDLVNMSGFSDKGIEDYLKDKKPKTVGISCFTFNVHTVIKLCKKIKKINPEIKTILGGPHATFMYKQLLENVPEIDVIVLYEGEESFKEIADGRDFGEIKGIALKKEKRIIKNPPKKPIENLDMLPIPAKYCKYQRIITSRGCPGSCIFCSTPQFWGRNVRFRSPESVVEELELLNRQGLGFFIFSDDTFTMNRDRVIKICKLIIEKGLKITWDCRSRVNLICEERLKWMKRAGCISISYGVESGSPKILKSMNKHITPAEILNAAELTRKFGLSMNFFLIVGAPGEDDATVQETIGMLKQARPHSIQAYVMHLTPDTGLCRDSMLVDDSFWLREGDKTVYYTKEHSLEKLKGYAAKIYEEFAGISCSYSFKEIISLIKKYPESATQEFNNLGLFYMSKGMLEDAFIAFKKSLKLNKGNYQAYNNLGVLFTQKNNRQKAEEYFKKAVEANPEDLVAAGNLKKISAESRK